MHAGWQRWGFELFLGLIPRNANDLRRPGAVNWTPCVACTSRGYDQLECSYKDRQHSREGRCTAESVAV
jgi:hypothetical protein